MKKKRLLLILGAAAVLFVAGIATVAGLLIWRERSLPIYTEAQQGLAGGERVTNTLALNGVLYVNSLPEFVLDPLGRGRRVGKTAGGMRIYAPAGQGANPDYLILTGFMFPDTVYRRADAPVFDPQRIPISELRLTANMGWDPRLQKTQDPALIAELLARLKHPGPLTALKPDRVYFLELLSPQAPGVFYVVYVAIAPDGSVFLAEKASPEAWFAAGEGLAQWARRVTGQAGGQ